MATGKRYKDGDRLHAGVFNALLSTVENLESDVDELKRKLPKRTSQLINDSGFITKDNNTWRSIKVNNTEVLGSTNIKPLNLLPGDGVTMSYDNNGNVTIASTGGGTGTTYEAGTNIEINGNVISALDKTTSEIQLSDGAPIDATGIWPDNKIPEGTSVQVILEKLLLKEVFPSAAKKPSMSLSGGTNLGTFIIGTSVTIPAITMQKNVGKFDKDGNVIANSGRTPSITWSNEKITTSVSKFSGATVSSGTTGTTSVSANVELGTNQVTYSGSVNYTKPSNFPVTNLGHETQSTTKVITTGTTDISAIWAASSITTSTTVSATGVYPVYTNIRGAVLSDSALTTVSLSKLSSNYKEITLVDVPSEHDSGDVHFVFEYPSGRTCTFQIKDLSGNFVNYASSYSESGTPEHAGYIRLETTGNVYQGINTYKLILSKALNS